MRMPPLDTDEITSLDPIRFATQLFELEGRDIAPCLKLVQSVSLQKLASDYGLLRKIHSDHAQTLACVESGLTQARQVLTSFESRFTQQVMRYFLLGAEDASIESLEHEAYLADSLERELAGAVQVVAFHSILFQECSHIHTEVGARLTAALRHDQSRRVQIGKHLDRIASVLRELVSHS